MQDLVHTGVMKKLINSPQEVVREADRIPGHTELFRERARRRYATGRRQDALVDELPDLIGDLRLQRLGALPSDRER